MRKIHKIVNIALICTVIGVLVCPDLYALRPPLRFSDTAEEAIDFQKHKETIDSLKLLARKHIIHKLGNSGITASLNFLILLLQKYDKQEFVELCVETGEQWYEMITNKDLWKLDIETLLKRIKNTADSTTYIIEKAEGLLEEGTFEGADKDKALDIIEEVRKDRNTLLYFLEAVPRLRATANINEVISIYTKMGVTFDLELQLSSEEGLIFEKVIEDESLTIFSIIDNFFKNAMRVGFSPLIPKITIKTARENDKWIKIEALDTNKGIPRENLPKIFDEGFTTDSSGIGGQGLYLMLEYLKLIGGKVEVDSKTKGNKAYRLSFVDDKLEEMEISESKRAETGTTFTIWLPASSSLGEVTPKRVSIDEAKEILLTNLQAIYDSLPSFSKALKNGAETLKDKGIGKFEGESLPEIEKIKAIIEEKIDNIVTLPASLGIVETEQQKRLDEFLSEIAEEFDVDKVFIEFDELWHFTYTYGFTEEEFFNFNRAREEIYSVIEKVYGTAAELRKKEGIEALKRCDIHSVVSASLTGGVYGDSENCINIIAGRSEKTVSQFGELNGQNRESIEERLKALIETGQMPWSTIAKSLIKQGYGTFSLFMSVLRHNGGIAEFSHALFPLLKRIRSDSDKSEEFFEELAASLEHYAETMHKQIASQNRTFSNLLKAGTDFKTRNITQRLNERILSFNSVVEAKGLKYTVNLTDEDLFIGNCDSNLLDIAVDNIIQNAIKYTPEGKIMVRVSKKPMDYEDLKEPKVSAVIEIEDTGMGIPEEEKGRIFERGYRATNVEEIQGEGIGLGAVSAILTTMDGKIHVESEEDKGTKFTIYFPIVEPSSLIEQKLHFGATQKSL